MDITERERKIMLFLLQTQGEVTVKDLSLGLDVSTRTIHRDLKGVENFLFDFHLELEKKSGVGLRILGSKANKQRLERILSNVVSKDYTQEERKTMILSILLEIKEPVKLFALANELDVTIATVSHDLDQLEEELANFHLTLIRKRGFGVKIEGKEANKRSAITYLISKYVDPFAFTSLLKENIQSKRMPTISNRLLGLVNPENLQVIEKTVERVSTALPYELADSAYVGLVVHLALAMERLQKGETIQFDQANFQQMKDTKEYTIAKKLISELEIALEMDIPDDEIGYITMHLMGAKLREDPHFLLELESPGFVYQVKQLIASVSEEVNVDVTANNQLLNDLVTHLKPAIYRMRKQMNITNPMIDQIKQDYPALFQLIAEAVKEIFPDLNFPDDEIGFLVLHFAATFLKGENLKAMVICSSGIGSAKILATKLMKQIPEIKQIENKSLFDVQRKDLDQYDLIVSTIPLKELEETDYVLASPMLSASEVNHIKKSIRQKKLYVKKKNEKSSTNALMKLETIKHYTDTILDLLDSFYVDTISENRSVLQMICMDLQKRKRIKNWKAIFNKLQEREQVGGLGIPNTNLALYHTRSEDVNVLHFSIYILEKPMTLKGMNEEEMAVQSILMMLAPEEIHQEGLDTLSYLSSLLIQEEKAVQLFESGNEEGIKRFLADQFQAFVKDKQLL